MHAGIEVLVSAMRLHIKDAVLQEQACWALLYIASVDAKTGELVGALGGVKVVVQAMQAHGVYVCVCMCAYTWIQ
jgi:hypothetical protein